MKKITQLTAAFASLVFMIGVSSAPATAVVTTIKDCAFGTAQVFDVQWNISGSVATNDAVLNISDVTRPYGDVPGGQLAAADWQTGYYVQFVDSVSDPGTLALERFNSSNVSQGLLDTTGTFSAYGDDFIFYQGGGMFGTVITTGNGFEYGASASLPITAENPTTAEMLAYTNCLETTLAAGESRDGDGGGDDGGGGGGGGGGGSRDAGDANRLASTGFSGYDPALTGFIGVMTLIVGAGAILRRRARG
jgi:hypothetical protein